MVCEDDFITRPTLICASLFEKLEYPDACKDKTEMIFLIFFMVSFWYQIGIKKRLSKFQMSTMEYRPAREFLSKQK